MQVFYRLFVALILYATFPNATTAIEYEVLSTFTVRWFIQNVKPEFLPIKGKLKDVCLFYSRGMSRKARSQARIYKLVTIWDLWDCKYYMDDQTEGNTMKDIIEMTLQPLVDDNRQPVVDQNTGLQVHMYQPKKETLIYFSRMSRAMATMCSGKTYSVHKNIQEIPKNGIFTTVELKALQQKMKPTACNIVTSIFGTTYPSCPLEDQLNGLLASWPTPRFDPNPPAQTTPNNKRALYIFKRVNEEQCTDDNVWTTVDHWDLVPDAWSDVSGYIDQIEDGTVDLDDPNCIEDS